MGNPRSGVPASTASSEWGFSLRLMRWRQGAGGIPQPQGPPTGEDEEEEGAEPSLLTPGPPLTSGSQRWICRWGGAERSAACTCAGPGGRRPGSKSPRCHRRGRALLQ
ncbi:hypothetical protein NDU88_002862 [Pleurodeles waltl]|uniref:Uncharacterized protein n=1 Tax=Pleurodeles waltl TaxID=8319 RepID=A0AAV7W3D2_PLEWA|nr:hypothetical protein NDU88_002862 [Pleurodeles waltl]